MSTSPTTPWRECRAFATVLDPAEATQTVSWNDLYDQLGKAIARMSPQQAASQARYISELGQGKILELWLLDEDHVDPSGDGLEPASSYSAEELVDEQRWPKGLALLCIQ